MHILTNLLIEDDVHEYIIKKIFLNSKINKFEINMIMPKRGNTYIKTNLSKYNEAAKRISYVVLTDLDNTSCPVELINKWINFHKHHNLIFRIAVREAESWLLADKGNIAKFLGVSRNSIPQYPDTIRDPKEFLIKLARKSNKRLIRDDIVPKGSARVGRAYNSTLGTFISNDWNVDHAATNSESLRRFLRALDSFVPQVAK